MVIPQREFSGGDQTAGYLVQVLPGPQRLNVKMWGLWKDPALIPQFKLEVLISMNILAEKGPWNVFGDLTGYSAQPTPVGDLISSLMSEAMRKKFNKCGVITDNMVARLFISRLTDLVGMTTLKFFKTPAEVEAYLKVP